MHKIFIRLQRWVLALFIVDCTPDPLAGLDLRELADLPATHPPRDDSC